MAGACAGAARAEVALEGAIHPLIGKPSGDQTHPSASFGDTRGYLVWQDNATDGDGLGVSARRLDLNGNPVGEAFRVNVGGSDDQENPNVVMLPDGSALFVWQSGVRGKQSIYSRLLGANGVFVTDDVKLSADGSGNRNPVVAAVSDGTAVVSWASTAADDNLLGIHAQRIAANGQKSGSLIPVNQFTSYNQRNPSIAPHPDGGFTVAWISEQQTGPNRTDVYLRRFGTTGTPVSDETRANTAELPCAGTSLIAIGQGRLAVAWSQMDTTGGTLSWSAKARLIDANGNGGAVVPVSGTLAGSHTQVRLSSSGDRIMAVWVGNQFDASARARIGGRLIGNDGTPIGDVMTLDADGIGDQITPAIATHGTGKFLAVWSGWSGLSSGMDLVSQRFSPTTSPLVALDAPIVQGLSSWQMKATWAPLVGASVKQYEVYLDGATTPETVSDSFWNSPDVLPGTTHTIQIAYVLADGRRSPLSPPAQGKSWGKDNNGDGLPDDWQTAYFGPSPADWPSPDADTDGDGVSNRQEFLTGTSPVDATDVLKVAVGVTPQGYMLQWSSHAGGIYQLQTSDDLKTWSNVGGYRFAASTNDSVLVTGVPPNSYFRVNRIR